MTNIEQQPSLVDGTISVIVKLISYRCSISYMYTFVICTHLLG